MKNDSHPAAPAPAAWIGWDWADQHHDLLLETADGAVEKTRLPHEPGRLHAWLQELGRRLGPGRKAALGLEATRSALLPIFQEYSFLVVYLINPRSAAHFREALRPGRSKSDDLDRHLLAQMVKSHAALLHPVVPEDPLTQELRHLVESRRRLVSHRADLANELTSALKLYYPLALELLEQDTTTRLAADFILRFPVLSALQKARADGARKFFLDHGCRLTQGLERRLALIAGAAAVTTQGAWNHPHSLMACALARQIRASSASVEKLEERIALLASQHPNRALAESVPGAAAALEPRLMVALGTDPENFPSAEARAVASGVAPLRRQSGNACQVSRRVAKPKFLHQTWIEFAKCSTLQCDWAREFVQAKLKAGKTYFTAIRALAYKWIRILHACWRNGTEYDEAQYLDALKMRRSPYCPVPTVKN